MIKLIKEDDIRSYNWRTRRVGGYILLRYDYTLVTRLTTTPLTWETVIGKVVRDIN